MAGELDTIKALIIMLQNEINWCYDHPQPVDARSDDEQAGFVKGLRQAQLLLTRAISELRLADKNEK